MCATAVQILVRYLEGTPTKNRKRFQMFTVFFEVKLRVQGIRQNLLRQNSQNVDTSTYFQMKSQGQRTSFNLTCALLYLNLFLGCPNH